MSDWDSLRENTLLNRRRIAEALAPESERARVVPPTWNNNLYWQAGHLVVSPRALTRGLAGEPLGVPEEYRAWFARNSSPASWGSDDIPPFDSLVAQIEETMVELFDDYEDRPDFQFPSPYQTSVGVVLRTPVDALTFSLVHDGFHSGSIHALKRALDGLAMANPG